MRILIALERVPLSCAILSNQLALDALHVSAGATRQPSCHVWHHAPAVLEIRALESWACSATAAMSSSLGVAKDTRTHTDNIIWLAFLCA